MSLVEDFAQALIRQSVVELSPEVVHETRRTFLNVLGTAIGASHADELDALASIGIARGGGEVCPPGRKDRLDRYMTALSIGLAAHYDDYDDTHLETVIHPGAATLGAVYPLALITNASGPLCLQAFALGVESQLRLGIAMSPSHYDLGWHITGTCGVVGAAVASGLLRGHDETQLASAIVAALNFTVGQREAFGTSAKPYHAGKAASNGLLASALADAGSEPGSRLLERDRGFFAAFASEFDSSWLTEPSIGSRFVLLDNTYKPFPCGIVAHPAIEAAIALRSRLGEHAVSSIRAVSLRCNPLVPELMGRTEVSTGLEARFCVFHGVAVGLLFGKAGLHEFSDQFAIDPSVVALRNLTVLDIDPSCPRNAATLTLELADGTREVAAVEVAAGSRERPLSDDQLLEKFTALVEPVLPGQSASIAEAAMRLGETSVSAIEAAVRGHD